MKIKQILQAVFLLCVINISAAYAISATTSTNINFGTIIQTSTTTALTMGASGSVTVTGGISKGGASLGVIDVTASADRNYYERVTDVTASSGASQTLAEGCTAVLTEASTSEDKYKIFSLSPSNSSGSCSSLPQSQAIAVKASLRLNGYCKDGTYTIQQASYTFNNYICNPNNTGSCYIGGSACTHSNATAIVPATFTIQQALNISEQQALDFGTIISQNTVQEVRIDINGNRTGGLNLNNGSAGKQGVFFVTGAPSTRVNITMDKNASLNDGSNNSMAADLTASATSVTLSDSGYGKISIGGALVVAANQPAGQYSGTYTINVSY